MCIPCVMCGACMGLSEDGAPIASETSCPECGEVVGATDVTCPHCFTFLPANAMLKKRVEERAAESEDERGF